MNKLLLIARYAKAGAPLKSLEPLEFIARVAGPSLFRKLFPLLSEKLPLLFEKFVEVFLRFLGVKSRAPSAGVPLFPGKRVLKCTFRVGLPFSQGIIPLSLLLIVQNLVGFGDRLEFLAVLALIPIRVVILGKSVEGILDFIL